MPLNDNNSAVAMKAMFARLGFNTTTCTKLVDEEGLKSLEKYRKCSLDRCKDTIKALRHPGGTLAGETVSAHAAHNLSMGYHVCNVWERTHRFGMGITDVKITGDLFERAERQATLEANHDNKFYLDSHLPYKDSDVKVEFQAKWEEFDAELSSVRGASGIPLSYMTRQRLIPKPEADDKEDDYASIDAQMIQRAQIIKTDSIAMDVDELEEAGPSKKTATAKLDNNLLYDLMKAKYAKTTAWCHTKSCGRDRDGRRAMIAMFVNSLGKNAIENRFSEAQERIRGIVYRGEKARWNWDRYVLEMKKCHEERYALVIHGHADLTDREKVYYLIKGIKTPDLEATVTLIESSPEHREDFDAAQLLLTEAVRRAKARELTRNVSMTATGRGRGDGGRGRGRDRRGRHGRGNPDRQGRDPPTHNGRFDSNTARDSNGSYDMQGILNGDYDFLIQKLTHINRPSYSKEEYDRLNPLERRKNWFNQQKQKSNPTWRPPRSPSVHIPRSVAEISILTDDMKSMKRTVDNQKLTIAKLTARLEESDDEKSLFSSGGSVDPPATSNSNNSALVRQKRRKTKGTTRVG